MLRVLIIDDEPLARQNLRQMLTQHAVLKVVGEADSVPEALRLVREEKPDAVFLDVQMPGADGFSLLRGLEHPPRVVFVTAHAAHAAEAFDFDAVDYLLKPVRPERLAVAVGRLEDKTAAAEPWQAKDRICLKTPERTLIATPGMIAALEADGDFTRIHIKGERPMLICHNLSFYEKTLPSPPFVRLDRSLMINALRVTKIEAVPSERDHERLSLAGVGKEFLLGRAAHHRLVEAMKSGSPLS